MLQMLDSWNILKNCNESFNLAFNFLGMDITLIKTGWTQLYKGQLFN